MIDHGQWSDELSDAVADVLDDAERTGMAVAALLDFHWAHRDPEAEDELGGQALALVLALMEDYIERTA